MTLQGVDYSYSGPMTAAQVKANGLAFVCRYVSTPGAGKNIRQSEVDDFKAHGVGIVIVFEDGAGSALGGYTQGMADARCADAQVHSLCLTGIPIYFAVDFDAQPFQYASLVDYFRGVTAVLGSARVGAYGGFYVIKRLFENNAVRYAWQAIAWSDGNIDPRAHIFQGSGATVAGVNVDLDRTVSSDIDFGQWNPTPTDWFDMATVKDLQTAITGEVSPFVKAQTAINTRVIASLTRLEARDNFPCQLVQSSLPTGAPTGPVRIIGPGIIVALRSGAEVQALVAAKLVSGHATILSADDHANLLAVFTRSQ